MKRFIGSAIGLLGLLALCANTDGGYINISWADPHWGYNPNLIEHGDFGLAANEATLKH